MVGQRGRVCPLRTAHYCVAGVFIPLYFSGPSLASDSSTDQQFENTYSDQESIIDHLNYVAAGDCSYVTYVRFVVLTGFVSWSIVAKTTYLVTKDIWWDINLGSLHKQKEVYI